MSTSGWRNHRPEALDTENKGFLASTLKGTENALGHESARLTPGLKAQG
ncbi:hypothetical protein [Streptomyces sp. NPDC050416]